MQDKFEIFGKGTVLHHGKLNNRVYLMKLHEPDFPEVIKYIDLLAKKHSYLKLFCKVPYWAVPAFLSNGFFMEAHIPNFYNGRTDAFFMSRFSGTGQSIATSQENLNILSQQLLRITRAKPLPILKEGFIVRQLDDSCAEKISELYKAVFDTYPFPIFDPGYIRETIKNKVQYFGIEKDGKLAALSSAEVDNKGGNAEMTDFATLPDYRGNSLSVILLNLMEDAMKQQGIATLYTIARLNSIAMNITFLKMEYKYAGTLLNNTNIAGKIESMNVLYKHI